MSRHERKAWFVVGAHFTALFFILGSAYDAQTVFVPELVKHFGWSRAQIGLLFSALSVAAAISAPIGGWLLDRIDARVVVCSGAALAALGLFSSAEASGFFPMLLAFFAIGLGMAASGYVPAAVVVSNWFNEERRGSAVGVAMAGETAGAMVMTLVASFLIAMYGWRLAYLALAIPILVVVIPMVLVVVRTRPPVAPVPREQHATVGLEVAEAIRSASFWLIGFAEFGGGLFVTAVWIHLAAYLRELGYSEHFTALTLGSTMALATLGQPVMGYLGDHVGVRSALVATFLLDAISFIVVLRAGQLFYLSVFVLFFGLLLTAPVTLLAVAIVNSLGLKRYGSLAGIMGFFFVFGCIFGPLVAGRIFDLTGSYAASFLLCSVLSAFCAAAIWLTTPLQTDSAGLGLRNREISKA